VEGGRGIERWFTALGVACFLYVLSLDAPNGATKSRAWMNLGAAYIHKKEYRLAYGALKKAEELDHWPGFEMGKTLVYWNLAIACSNLKQHEEAYCYLMEIVRIGEERGQYYIPLDRLRAAIKITWKANGGRAVYCEIP
jgi:tetratricopeptide (TPR) repeat protein